MKTTLDSIEWIKFPVVEDIRGNLTFIQNEHLPFKMKRIYYLFDVPCNAFRGGHAHIYQREILIALSGSFEVVTDDGEKRKTIFLNNPKIGLYIPDGIWRELQNFSSGAICLVIAQDNFDETDYIRNYEDFLHLKK